jgi:outer membrane immunogenic protein
VKKLFATASILALSSAAVSAADLPMKAPPYAAPISVFSWTGCYVGAHGGGGTMHDSNTQDFNPLFGFSSTQNGGTGTGGVAGGQIGCNYQDGNAVFGLEGEGYWSGIRTSTGVSETITEGATTFNETFNSTSRNKSDFSIAARFGLAFDRTLVYGKAGWVWGRFDFGTSETTSVTGEGSTIRAFTQSGTLDGLLLGVGVEHAFTQNWTVKLEYNFLDFGSKALNASCFDGGSGSCTGLLLSTTQHAQKHIFKVGFNYLFNAWGAPPLVAKY